MDVWKHSMFEYQTILHENEEEMKAEMARYRADFWILEECDWVSFNIEALNDFLEKFGSNYSIELTGYTMLNPRPTTFSVRMTKWKRELSTGIKSSDLFNLQRRRIG